MAPSQVVEYGVEPGWPVADRGQGLCQDLVRRDVVVAHPLEAEEIPPRPRRRSLQAQPEQELDDGVRHHGLEWWQGSNDSRLSRESFVTQKPLNASSGVGLLGTDRLGPDPGQVAADTASTARHFAAAPCQRGVAGGAGIDQPRPVDGACGYEGQVPHSKMPPCLVQACRADLATTGDTPVQRAKWQSAVPEEDERIIRIPTPQWHQGFHRNVGLGSQAHQAIQRHPRPRVRHAGPARQTRGRLHPAYPGQAEDEALEALILGWQQPHTGLWACAGRRKWLWRKRHGAGVYKDSAPAVDRAARGRTGPRILLLCPDGPSPRAAR